MVETRQTEEWNHTASLLAMIHNVNCTKVSQAKAPKDFHPLYVNRKSGRVSITKDTIWMLKALLPANKR